MEPNNETRAICSEFSAKTTPGEGWRPLELNSDEFRGDLKEFNLTTEQENELLQALWRLMSMLVEFGWSVDNMQWILPELFAPEESGVVGSEDGEENGKGN